MPRRRDGLARRATPPSRILAIRHALDGHTCCSRLAAMSAQSASAILACIPPREFYFVDHPYWIGTALALVVLDHAARQWRRVRPRCRPGLRCLATIGCTLASIATLVLLVGACDLDSVEQTARLALEATLLAAGSLYLEVWLDDRELVPRAVGRVRRERRSSRS